MARKVFISVLGTGLYKNCKYVASDFTSPETAFVQQATLLYNGAIDWPADSKAFILLTDNARKENWDVPLKKRYDWATKTEVPYVGLHEVLDEMRLPFDAEGISIPDGGDKDEMWLVFERVYGLLEDGDELYFDLTHSFRYLPMLMLVLGNYAKFLKNAKVCSITYGNYEARNKDTNEAPIIDLLPLSSLQDWTFATADYLKNGYADILVGLSQRELAPLMRSVETRTDDVRRLKDFVKHLEVMSTELQTCRGLNIIESTSVQSIKNDLESLQTVVISQLTPVLEKVKNSIAIFERQSDVRNGFLAAKWCYDNHQYQQAVTFMEESVISYFGKRHGIGLKDADRRELVTSAFNILNAAIPPENWRVKNTEWVGLLHEIVDDIKANYGDMVSKMGSLMSLRNDYNHCGMRDGALMPERMKRKIGTLLSDMSTRLYEQEKKST